MAPFSEINVFELSRYNEPYDKHWGVIVRSPPYVTLTKPLQTLIRGTRPRTRLALNTQHSSFEQTKFVSPGIRLGQCWILKKLLPRCLFHEQPDHLQQQTSNMFYGSLFLLEDIALSWNSFHSEPGAEYCIDIYGHLLQAQLAKNLKNLYLLHIFSGSECVDKVVRGPDGGAGPDGRQSHGDPYQVQELRQDQLQLHQLWPAVLWRPAAGARHGDGQLGQARGARSEGRVTGEKQKIFNVLLNISWLVTLLSVTRVTVGSSVSPHVTSWCKHCHKQFINMSTITNKQRGTPY